MTFGARKILFRKILPQPAGFGAQFEVLKNVFNNSHRNIIRHEDLT